MGRSPLRFGASETGCIRGARADGRPLAVSTTAMESAGLQRWGLRGTCGAERVH